MEIEFDTGKEESKRKRKVAHKKKIPLKVLFFSFFVALILVFIFLFLKSVTHKTSAKDAFEVWIDKSKVEVKQNQSSEVIHLYVKQVQDLDENLTVTIFIENENPEFVKVIDAITLEQLESFQTFEFNKKGLIYLKNFQILAFKVTGQEYSPWKITIKCVAKNITICEKPINIVVK